MSLTSHSPLYMDKGREETDFNVTLHLCKLTALAIPWGGWRGSRILFDDWFCYVMMWMQSNPIHQLANCPEMNHYDESMAIWTSPALSLQPERSHTTGLPGLRTQVHSFHPTQGMLLMTQPSGYFRHGLGSWARHRVQKWMAQGHFHVAHILIY